MVTRSQLTPLCGKHTDQWSLANTTSPGRLGLREEPEVDGSGVWPGNAPKVNERALKEAVHLLLTPGQKRATQAGPGKQGGMTSVGHLK